MTSRNQLQYFTSPRVATNHITSSHLAANRHHSTSHHSTPHHHNRRATKTQPAITKTPPPGGMAETWRAQKLGLGSSLVGGPAQSFFPPEISGPGSPRNYGIITIDKTTLSRGSSGP